MSNIEPSFESKSNPSKSKIQSANENNDKSIKSVSVKLPNFWINSPQTWFIQADAQFSLYNVKSDRLRYHMVVASLPQEVIESVIDVL